MTFTFLVQYRSKFCRSRCRSSTSCRSKLLSCVQVNFHRLTRGTTLAKTAKTPADGQWQRVVLVDGDHFSATRHADTSHQCGLPSRAADAQVMFHVPFAGRGSRRSNSRTVSMVGQCLRIRRPSCATLTDTSGVTTLYSTSPSRLKNATREKSKSKLVRSERALSPGTGTDQERIRNPNIKSNKKLCWQ